jgi:cell division protein FtsB
MRVSLKVRRFFMSAILPTISAAVIFYFGYNVIWGERGLLALERAQAQLSVAQNQLFQIDGDRSRLEHRIALIKAGDPDLVEELARNELMDGAPGQVAVPRRRR